MNNNKDKNLFDEQKEIGKSLLDKKEYDQAIRYFSEMAYLSEKNHCDKALAISKYYMAICLNHLEKVNMACDILQEVTEIAERIRNPQIVIHSEIIRAHLFIRLGHNDRASRILQDLYLNFALLV